jgi:hypothetical protein
MRERNEATAYFAYRKLGTKIGAGFALVLLVLAVSSGVAWYAFSRVAARVSEYARLVDNADAFTDIDLALSQYHGHVHEYVVSDDEATAALAMKDQDKLRELIAAALARATNPARRQMLESMAKDAATYIGQFGHMHQLNSEQLKLQASVLDVAGPQITDGFSALIEAASADDAKMRDWRRRGAT